MNPFLPKTVRRAFHSDKPELPLFKDKKPQDKYFSRSARLSKKVLLIRAVLALLAVFLIYHLFGSAQSGKYSRGYPSWSRAKDEVREVLLDSWHAYEDNAWGKDIYNAVSGSGKNIGPTPMGWMIVDLLDTLWLMDLKDEFNKAKQWVKTDLKYEQNFDVSTFETTIRMLGGLLSAFALSDEDIFLERAAELANNMLGAFDTVTGLPHSEINLKTGKGRTYNLQLSIAEIGTLQLEFKYLSKVTGEDLYWRKAERVMAVLDANQPEDGLAPIDVNINSGAYMKNRILFGSRGDSFYEYLLKQYLQTKYQEPVYWQMYKESVEGVKKHLVGHSKPNGLTFIGELERGFGDNLLPKMDHLVCFYPGLLALGATGGQSLSKARKLSNWSEDKESDFRLAEELTETCYQMYNTTATGLSGEIAMFNTKEGGENDITYKPTDVHNLQRPETVESLYYMYKFTGNEKYRKWGYDIFRSFVKATQYIGHDGRITYTCLKDVTTTAPSHNDNMESFWLAETLKYLYLLFDDSDLVPLTEYVFNTEAHPLPRFDMKPLFKTGWQRDASDPRSGKRFAPGVGALEVKAEPDRKGIKGGKKEMPRAAPAAKKIDDAAHDMIKNDPSIQKAEKEEKKKVEKALKEIEKAVG